jgi:hypothetical protein
VQRVALFHLAISLPRQICYNEGMKTRALRHPITSLSALVASAAFLLGGCSTTKNVDWDIRVGSFTYDQAIAELGPPESQRSLGDGRTVAVWTTRRSSGNGSGVVGRGYAGNTVAGASHSEITGHSERVLRLTFNAEGRLAAWSKNY